MITIPMLILLSIVAGTSLLVLRQYLRQSRKVKALVAKGHR
jgi:hypothetical protein